MPAKANGGISQENLKNNKVHLAVKIKTQEQIEKNCICLKNRNLILKRKFRGWRVKG